MKARADELRVRWPLFGYKDDYNKLKDVPSVHVFFEPSRGELGSSSTLVWVENDDDLSANTIEWLDRKHEQLKVFLEYMQKYPNLYFAITQTPPHVPDAVWVRHTLPDGTERDGTGMLYGKDELRDPIILDHLNYQAGKARQEGYFWCSGCDEVHPQEEYAYFYFAGEYCKKFKEENPDHYRMAKNESYN